MTLHERTAIRELLDAWDTPDSPELLTYAIYQLQRIYRSSTTKKPTNQSDEHHHKTTTNRRTHGRAA
jgi:hypothetical protein